MSIVTITLNNKNFQLACNDGDGSEEQLRNLAALLNEKIIEIKHANPSASFELLLVMTALSLQDQIQVLTPKLGVASSAKNNYEDEKFAETLSTIAHYLENLAKKIGR